MSSSIEAAESSPPENLLSNYSPLPGSYDELLDDRGQIRESWRQFTAGLEAMGSQGLDQRNEQARRLLRENGLMQGVAGSSHGTDRHWELDPLPLLLAKSEWDSLVPALTQRVQLLNLILADLYGPQNLIREALIPPELVFGQPSFLLPCHGLVATRNIFLHLYASHLVRGADGRWSVYADYTHCPAGAGLALENRIITSRILPTDFHSLHVERLAGFFITLRDTLQSLSVQRSDNPRVVLLSPGPRSPSYFEDAYLARYLGYTLVEGGDLTVRGTNVYLKTLGGLLPVDVIIRRMHGEEADPLELRYDSTYGVAGLVQAVRNGQVVVANALGSGLLESSALMAFLPAICRKQLGEELKLPSVPTWWCGRDEDWSYIQAHFDELVIRPAIPWRSHGPVDTALLDRQQREHLLETVCQHRTAFVAQARMNRSTAPVFINGGVEAWPIGMRVFAAASRDGAFQVMPGGLARAMSPSHGRASISRPDGAVEPDEPQAGSRVKDVWILSDRPVATITLLRPQAAAVELRRSSNDLPSRVADNLYWLGRHIERADGLVRHLRTVVMRMTSELAPSNLPEMKVLVQMLADDARPVEKLPNDPEELVAALESEILAAFVHESRSGTLDETLRSLYRTASLVRDRISADTWRIVNQLDLELLSPRPPNTVRLGDTLSVLNQVFNLLSALSGLMTESMTRGPGWRFVDMGRRLERGLTVLRLLRKTLVHNPAESTSLLESVLEIADSAMTYRYRYMTSLQLAPLLDLLLTDETNPRSVGYQLAALADHVRQLPGKDTNPLRNPETRIMIATQAELRLVDVEALARPREGGVRWTLDNFLADMTLQLWQLSDSLTQTYFTHTGPSR
ncbi:MAG: circularly permuted type 2 ATP-grasp protein, partial [Thermoguttaceae bacterium]